MTSSVLPYSDEISGVPGKHASSLGWNIMSFNAHDQHVMTSPWPTQGCDGRRPLEVSYRADPRLDAAVFL